MIDGDEPLLGRPEDHRLLASPAVGIAVHQRHLVKEMARFLAGARRSWDWPRRPAGRRTHSGASSVNRPDRIDRAEDGKLIGSARLVVFGTVAGCGMNQPGAVLHADVPGQHDRRDPIDERVAILGVLQLPPRHRPTSVILGDLRQRHDLGHQVGGQDRPDGPSRCRIGVADSGVGQVGMNGDRHVGRQGPGGGRPDHRVPVVIVRAVRAGPRRGHARDHGEIDVDAGRGLFVVLQLGLGERRAIGHAPVDRLELAEDVALLEQVGQDVEDAGLVPRVERQVGIVPVAKHAQPAELLALDVHPLHRLGVAERADLGLAHRGRLRAQLLDDLVLDRQAVAVPARAHRGCRTPSSSAIERRSP